MGIQQDYSEGDFPERLSPDAAEEILRRTSVFDLDPGSSPRSRRQAAFNVLMDQPDAIARLHRLARSGGAPARLYAMCGLLIAAREDGLTLARQIAASPGSVAIKSADVIYEPTLSYAVARAFIEDLPTRMRVPRSKPIP